MLPRWIPSRAGRPGRPAHCPAHRAARPTSETLESRLHLSADAVQVTLAADAPPPAPVNVVVRPAGLNEHRLTWNDVAGETGYVVLRRRQGEAEFADVATLAADAGSYLDLIDPGSFPAGTHLEYRVAASNDAGRSVSEIPQFITVGGPGGTGLQMRLWTSLVGDGATRNPDQVLNNALMRIAEPARNADGSAVAPVVDRPDVLVPDYGGANTVAIEWVGWIVAEQTKPYEFSVITADGGRLFLDGVEVIDGNWIDQAATEAFSEPVSLTAGQKVAVRFQMYEQGGAATARLRWNGANANAREDIPAVFLFPDSGQLDPNNAAAAIPNRPVTFTEVFANPVTDVQTAGFINVRWQDNAFGEAGYDVQRADNAAFTNPVLVSRRVDASNPSNPVTLELVGPGRDLFVDDGGYSLNGVSNLDTEKTYYYRIKPRGAPDTAYVVAGSAKPYGSVYNNNTGYYDTTNLVEAGWDLTLNNFPSTEMVTLNGRASVTAEKTIKLTHNQNDRWSSAWLNRAFDIDTDFKLTTDIRMGESNGADGMAFVIQNFTPGIPQGVTRSPLRQLGGGGGAIGYAGIANSVAVVFDFHDALDTLGVYVNGRTPPGGNLGAYGASIRTTPADVQQPNGSFDLRNTANLTPGAAPINLDSGTVFRLTVNYDEQGIDFDGDGTPSEFDTGLLTISLSDAADPTGKVLFTARYDIDIRSVVGTDTALMGWTAGTGGLNAKMEAYNFKIDYGGVCLSCGSIEELFVRGSSWRGNDNSPTNTTFMEYLKARGLGDDAYGYRLFANGAPTTGPTNNPEQILPWINLDEIVLRFTSESVGTSLPNPGAVTVSGQRSGVYPIAAVLSVAGDRTTYVLRLGRPLGGGDPVSGLAPAVVENGDRITVTVRGSILIGMDFSLRMNVLQGDVDHLNETVHNVLARDYAEVKKRFFKNTMSVPSNPDTDYTPFHDVDGNGQILARDYAEVKKRFFQNLPAAPAATAAAVSPLSPDRRRRPTERATLALLS